MFTYKSIKTIAVILSTNIALVMFALADDEKPPTNMIEYARWARETKEISTRIERLEKFMKEYLPSEEGGTNPDIKGYGDGSHGLAVAGCAWELARSYVKAGEKDKALKMFDWLQQYDSKSMLYPSIPKGKQAAPSGGDKP